MADIIFDEKNYAGIITLDRPQYLNALSHEMVIGIRNHLLKWRENQKIKFIIIKSAHDRFFCAGGDLKELYSLHQLNKPHKTKKFFQDSYELTKLIHHYPKPYISLINGIAMGGGMGISANGGFRVVSEKAIMCMPEVLIGLFPDAGAGHFFAQCPGVLGLFLGLTGYQMNAADALYTGLATHYIPKENFELLLETLLNAPLSSDFHSLVYEVIEMFAVGMPPLLSEIEENRSLIDKIFNQNLDEIIADCLLSKNVWLKKLGQNLSKASPLSLKITYKMLKEAPHKSFEYIFQQDLKLSSFCTEKGDFYEGIRALLIDKDQNPKWQFSSIEEVPENVMG